MRRVLAGAIVAACVLGCGREKADTLLVYCAGSMREPMEEIAKLYQAKFGQRVDLTFGDSGTITLQARERQIGDGYVVHDPFALIAENYGLVDETVRVAAMTPAIGVKVGTRGDREVTDLADLARPGLRIAIPHDTKSTCGQILAAMLKKTDFEEALKKNAQLVSRSSGDLVNALSLGTVDAMVGWDAVIRRDADLKVIPIADKYKVDAITSATDKAYPVRQLYVTISILKSSRKRESMKQLLDLAAGPEGQAVFKRLHYTPVAEVGP